MKKLLSLFLAAVCAAGAVTFSVSAASGAGNSNYNQLTGAGFPASYAAALAELKSKYPNWDFQPMFVGAELDEAVANERTPHSQQLIQMTSSNNSRNFYCTCSSCYKNGSFVIQEGSTWVSASESAVEYYMDPMNFFDERYIFQFEETSYDSAQTAAGIETIIRNTWMYNAVIRYKDSSGTTRTYTSSAYPNGVKYSQAILDAAKGSGMSAYYLASRIVQEVGGTTNSAGGASGTNSSYPGIYNYYNIGANSGYIDGLEWAAASSSGSTTNCNAILRQRATTSSSKIITVPKGTKVTIRSTTDVQPDGYKWYQISVTINSKTYSGYMRSDLVDQGDQYNRPWTNPYASIVNGAKYIANNFSEDQNTGYLQKFNVNPESSNMYSHEYMANVQAPSSEASNTYRAYSEAGLLSTVKTFIIPVYENVDPGITGFNVYARGDGGTDLYLDWNDFPEADGYRVYIVSSNSEILKGSTTASNFTFTDLTPSWEYTVMVVAYNSQGSVSSKTTVCAAPAPVEDLKAQSGSNSITAAWNSTSCHGYLIQWSTDSSFRTVAGSETISGSETTNYTINVSNPQNYYVRIRAWKNFNGSAVYGDFSKAVPADPVEDPPNTPDTPDIPETPDTSNKPTSPNGYNVYARGDGGTDLYLEWNKVSGADGYRVYIISGDKEILKGTATTNRFTFTDLVPSWEYRVMVVAFNEYGTSASKTTVCAAPSQVKNVKANASGNRITASWSSTTSHGYLIQWSKNSNFSTVAGSAEISGSDKTSYTINVNNAQDYYVRVRAWKNYAGSKVYGDFSTPSRAAAKPGAPNGYNVYARGDGGTDLYLEWNKVSNADGYRVYIISGDKEILKGTTNSNRFTFTDLVPSWEYRVMVVAFNENGSASSKTTVCAAPSQVKNVQANASGNRITASWSSTTSHGYLIQWSTSSNFSTVAGSAVISGSGKTNYTINVSNAKNYYVRVRAWKNFNGSTVYGDYSLPVSVNAGQ